MSSAPAVMETRKCSRAKASSWLLIGSWNEVTMTSQFSFPPGGKSSPALMPSSQVTAAKASSEDPNDETLCFGMDFRSSPWRLTVSRHSLSRPGDPAATGEGEDPGLHSVAPRSGTPRGLLRRPLHRQTGLRVGRHHRLQRQLPGPRQREAGVEEVHRRAPADVLLRERQVSRRLFKHC